ncbi:MAG TPA: hypothetical protein VFQ39_15990, partial [Longimicrobium sp.]|nr:hypothetical protein [Longimicrobium sp.]
TAAILNRRRVPAMVEELRGLREREKPEGVTWQAWTDAQLRDLDDLEHRAYTWLDENRGIPAAKPFMRPMLDVLDGVQSQHVHMVEQVHTRNLELWTPDRDTMAHGDRQRLAGAWNALRNGTGNIQTPGGAGGGAAGNELRSMHARLLSRPAGRRLLYTHLDVDPANTKGKRVDIAFTPPATRDPRVREQRGALEAQLRDVRARMTAYARDSEEYSDLDGTRRELMWQISELGGASEAAKARAQGVRDVHGWRDSHVDVQEGTRDSDTLARDWWGSYIPSPAWLQYGHELIHALHFRDDQDRTGVDLERYERTLWGNQEEYQTIAGPARGALTENLLRYEHGITARYGHGGGIARENL